jgi:hypothetical protein
LRFVCELETDEKQSSENFQHNLFTVTFSTSETFKFIRTKRCHDLPNSQIPNAEFKKKSKPFINKSIYQNLNFYFCITAKNKRIYSLQVLMELVQASLKFALDDNVSGV